MSTEAQLRAVITNSSNWIVSSVAPPDFTLPASCNYLNLNIVPLKLLSFTGNEQARQINLKWETAHEENHNHFEIEKSADGIYFINLGRIEAQGGFELSGS